jgi:predicted nucleic acid-binding protein
VIYLDTSVALAHLLAEDRSPPEALWGETLVSSRLLAFEVRTRLHARGLEASHGAAARQLVGRVALLEMIPEVLERAALPFPSPVRTLDALHLASIHFLAEQGQSPRLATYDRRMAEAAKALGFEIYHLG